MGNRTRFWNRCRVCFRLCRITVLLFILALVCAVIWLDRVGLPDFVKQPLIQALRQRGVELQFVRLRFNLVRGLVADNVHIGSSITNTPSMTFSQVRLELNYDALWHRKWQLDGLALRQGTLTFPVPDTNGPPIILTLDHIQTDVHFATNDVWSLDNFQADFAGATFTLSGELAHASTVQDWKIFHHKPSATGEEQARLRKIARALDQIHFHGISQMHLNVNGDARDFSSFAVHLAVNAPGANTPWGTASNMQFIVYSIGPIQQPKVLPAQPREINWVAHASQLVTTNLTADSIYLAGHWHAPMDLRWNAEVSRLVTPKLSADFISCGGSWHDPEMTITNLYVRLGKGDLRAAMDFNLQTRELSFTNSSCFDVSAVDSLLTEKTRERLAQYSLPSAPALRASGSLILPDWKAHTIDWRNDVQPTVRLKGELFLTNAGFNGLSFNKVHGFFSYSNEIWTVSDVVITRPEGKMAITGNENDTTRDYQWHLSGLFALDSIQPFLNAKALRGFHNFTFAEPLSLDANIRGRLYDYDSIEATGHLQLKHFTIRGEAVDNVESDFHYAHRVVEFFHPHLEAGLQTMHADGVLLDYAGDRVYFTNGLGTADPQMVATAIGPLTAKIMQPYHFPQLPTVRVNGYAPLRDGTNADLDFQSVGTTPVECLKVRTPALAGEIHWVRQTLVLTNMTGSFYGGNGNAWAFFDFHPHPGANFSFVVNLTNVDIHPLATDLASPTNHLEGLVSGHFVVTRGYSADWRSCFGYGNIDMRNGLLWDEPVFGILSPILNTISPNLGESRATDASATFIMTNGIISTDNLQIHTAMMGLLYTGTLDLQGNLNAHVTAELLRDVPGVGHVLSAVLWPVGKAFECNVSGTWKKPVSKLSYLPTSFLFEMLHPIHSLEDWSQSIPPPP
ncbi:MAG TPA: AsmA-like C-terminal region-containing protein [Pseudomonadales bacterium]|nr:AsmA-like C-terminal region-containing protein [Pseudomonadales bacterium]